MVGPRRCGKCKHLMKAGDSYHCFAPYQCEKQDVDPSWMAQPTEYVAYAEKPAPKAERKPSGMSLDILDRLESIERKLDVMMKMITEAIPQET